ncbi:acetoin dehydrogenase [[Bacillus] enclensis]|uniref:Dihydrolipoyl dehydrogenase n=1 Tax=[Bacillus] enclensis TaxID=1402860 RepID=A0A0V8HD45_9BACI|nr:dihydrolipoyl dehydrogenase [[Bacillus] enclensis]KSU60316.1 acetoin dehydrogenase [[Bacillus] enclensis]SCC23040.1 dihydrolipoamide dehydrogenase [[Bacillus] enclensis]
MKKYDIVVIGGGPGGYVAAIRAAQYGKKVGLVEARDLGGTCLNRGCIPSKTLLRHSEVIESIEKAKSWGIETGPVTLSLTKMLERKDQVIQKLRNGISFLLKKGKIDVLNGYGEVMQDGSIIVRAGEQEETITAGKIILATGSSPVIPAIPGLDQASYYTSDTIFEIERIPESIVIVGGGIIGVEFACIFSGLKVPVTIVEMGDRIVPGEDKDAARALAQSLRKKGVTVMTNSKVQEVVTSGGKQSVKVESESGKVEMVEGEALLLSVGRNPNTSAFSQLKLEMNGPFVKVDRKMRTSHPSVYAVGDVVGGWQLAHVASAEGLIAAANASGEKGEVDYKVVPRCVYTSPEIASVGITEEEAEKQGLSYKVTRVDHSSNGKALASDEKEGFVKLIADTKYGEILGVTMVGPHVTEMITEPAAFMHLEGTVEEMASMIHPHPTVSETLYEAAASWLGKGIHQ